MDAEWIVNVIDEKRGIDKQTATLIKDAIATGNLRKEISVYQNRPVNGKTIARSIKTINIDSIRLVKIGIQR